MLDLNNKSVLITGGTGSFGKMFTKLILKRYPNDFSDLTTHKINILAIKNLYILNNLGI